MWKIRPHSSSNEASFFSSVKDRLIARLLSQRNISPESVGDFLSCDYKTLAHPHSLNGVKEAADIFCEVAKQKGSVAVYGDYDADGILSSVMIKELCNVFKLKCRIFLPHRLDHGYGLNEKSLKSFKEFIKDHPLDLLIIVDCGTNNEEEIKELKKSIKSIIIIDHHIVDEAVISKSADSLINWRLNNTEEMSACGEVFQFIRGIRYLTKKVDPIEFLSYAAIGTIADVTPLGLNNRIIVRNGLREEALNSVRGCGLNALIRKSKVWGTLTQQDIAFKIAPRINASGRMSRPEIACKLMIERDHTTAEKVANILNKYNDERKNIQKKVETEAIKMVRENEDKYKHGIAVYNEDWALGVIGIVASKLAEAFNKPAIIFGKHDGVIKGSGRSVNGVSLKSIMDNCSEVFEKYGGHDAAAGATLKSDLPIDEVNEKFNEACQKYYETSEPVSAVRFYDAELKAETVSDECINKLGKNLYPYSNELNPEPIFLISNVLLTDTELIEGKNWKLLIFQGIKDKKKIGKKMKMFCNDNKVLGTEINGLFADIYFKLPQSTSDDLSVEDLVFHK